MLHSTTFGHASLLHQSVDSRRFEFRVTDTPTRYSLKATVNSREDTHVPSKRFSELVVASLIVLVGTLASAPPALAASKEKVLWAFNYADGNEPNGGLVMDSLGSLYGTTHLGGGPNGGLVFELARENDGSWTEKEIHVFGGSDGNVPEAGVIFDAAGTLYGTTAGGGAYNGGVVFQLSPGANGTWSERVLHNFGSGNDGIGPSGGLILDKEGNLYGTATFGGVGGSCYRGCGIVFQLKRCKNGRWTERILHAFTNNYADGCYPSATLTIDATGKLYGTTAGGGRYSCPGSDQGCGTVFELAPCRNGKWKERVIHSFNGNDGFFPFGAPLVLRSGKLYGTAPLGGKCTDGCGVVFEITHCRGGKWRERVLHAFDRGGLPDGVIFDASGNLYGTTGHGGRFNTNDACVNLGCGRAYELNPSSDGNWTLRCLHQFGGPGDGILPIGNLIFDTAGNLYGMTEGDLKLNCGPTEGCGAVFEITP